MTAATSTRRHAVAIVAAVALLAACGDPTGTTVRVDLQTVSAGATHTCALARDGSAYCWGDNEDGQLGDGSTNDSPVPARVSGGHVFTALTTGGLHTCGLVDGVAYCWGGNFYGQLGDGDTAESHLPVAVAGGHGFAAISAGATHTCAVTLTSVGYCWGSDRYGQVGDGSGVDAMPMTSPAPVAG